MIYGIEYFQLNQENRKFYKLPVTFTAMHDRYAANKKFEHIVKCLQNTKDILFVNVVSGTHRFKDDEVLRRAYYICEIDECTKGHYLVELRQYETNPYF